MSSNTSKKNIKKKEKTEINIDIVKNIEQDDLDELDSLLSSEQQTISTSKNITSKGKNNQKNFTNIKPEIQSKLIDNTSDLYDTIDFENKPKNFGNKWSDEDKKQLVSLLKENKAVEINYNEIANVLGRSEGGVKGEVKKMILTRYLNGEEPDLISVDLNVQYKFVKILIKTYIENEIDNDINNLEKENKLLKLKLENMELRKNIFNLTKKK